jgi:hypothetical protein
MLLRRFTQNRAFLMRVVMFAVAAGSLSLHYLPRVPHVSADLADGIGGLCYGVGIGTFVLWARARR